jgi:hypothetical protein
MEQQELIEKIKRLPHDRRAEVEAFIDSLSRQPGLDRHALYEALSDYANQHGGTEADLDPDLEAAAVEQLLKSG